MSSSESLRMTHNYLKTETAGLQQGYVNGRPLPDYIFSKFLNRADPIKYCENVLRAHLPENKRHLHENQIALVRAAINPNVKKLAALMSRQAGKTESIASFTGYLLDNVPGCRIGIFTPKIQQAEIDVGRTALFFQMNEEKLNNKLVKCNKQYIELGNRSSVRAVSASDQSNIEGLTFDIIILDEAQKISDYTVSERIVPMGGATNAKIIKIGTPKYKNHFHESVESHKEWLVIKRDWTQCPQLWANGATYIPDQETGELRPYSSYVLSLMPKMLKQEYFPHYPDIWTDGEMDPDDFKTQYMLHWVLDAGNYLSEGERELLIGEHSLISHGTAGEEYYAGIDFAGAATEGGDYTHISVIRKLPNGQKQKVFCKEFYGTEFPQQHREIMKLFGGPNPVFNCKKILADYTGCGAPVIQYLKDDGLTNIEGIVFNAADNYTKSGMNMKNLMFSQFKAEVANNRFKYAKRNNDFLYNKGLGEWDNLMFENRVGINKKIEGDPHDDVCCADVLGNFASTIGVLSSKMPRPVATRFRLR